jgi:hypothetical protein
LRGRGRDRLGGRRRLDLRGMMRDRGRRRWRRRDAPGGLGHTRLTGLARLDPNDAGFDQNIVGTADHKQMFEIVPAHQQQLALAIEIEGFDEAEPQLARPRPARQAPAQVNHDLDDLEDQNERDEKCDARQDPGQHAIVLKKCRHGRRLLLKTPTNSLLSISQGPRRCARKVKNWLIGMNISRPAATILLSTRPRILQIIGA